MIESDDGQINARKNHKDDNQNITKANGASVHWCDHGLLSHPLRFYYRCGLPLPNGMSQERDEVRSGPSPATLTK
jgi:hypothetical protein